MGIKVEVIKNTEADYKAAGVPGTALTDVQRSNIQTQVNESFAEFRGSVSAARPSVKADAMKGQVFNGTKAKSAGLVDAIGDKGYALDILRHAISTKLDPRFYAPK